MLPFFTFCDIPWWLTWLLPFLLGLGLGWLLWSRFKDLFDQSQSELSKSQMNLVDAQAKFDELKKHNSQLDGDLALCRGRIREMENMPKQKGATLVSKAAATVASPTSGDRWATAIGQDNLQIIEGIGPKMEEILKENGVNNFAALAGISKERLREILDKYGDKYRIIDPTSWPQQADMAKNGSYQDLVGYQKTLDAGRSDTMDGINDSKLEKFLIKAGVLKRWKQDDLKAVEGIGPKIEKLFQDAGIRTWADLSGTAISDLESILEKAGSRFKLADPSTWPKQAGLAAEGKWDELQQYQNALDGGKE